MGVGWGVVWVNLGFGCMGGGFWGVLGKGLGDLGF